MFKVILLVILVVGSISSMCFLKDNGVEKIGAINNYDLEEAIPSMENTAKQKQVNLVGNENFYGEKLYRNISQNQATNTSVDKADWLHLDRTVKKHLKSGELHWYKIFIDEFAKIGEYKIFTEYNGDKLDTYGHLYEVERDWNFDWFNSSYVPKYNEVERNDDSGYGLNFKIDRSFKANTYFYIMVRGWSSSSSGSYTLRFESPSNANISAGSDRKNATNIYEGQSAPLKLSAGDEHWFKVNLSSNKIYNMYTEGNIDTYGELYVW